ncbi:MAG: hypothetical protein GF416_00085 [Candidatus Altiarchaeales archaeon]|nr:hypothetical protein [Candidatus Altiarchaeales archaeon]MBD3415519.1 hypothetical protein [Candidatus Altiarchaeales archaeon]
MKDDHVFRALLFFIVYMHFDSFIKLVTGYHPLAHGFKYVIAAYLAFLAFLRVRDYRSPITVPILVFTSVVLAQLFNPLMLTGKGVLLSVLGLFYQVGYMPLFFIGYRLLDRERIDKLMKLLIFLAALSSLLAVFQLSVGFPEYLDYMPYEPTEFMIAHAYGYGPIAFDLLPPVHWYILGFIFCLCFFYRGQNRLLYGLIALDLLSFTIMSGIRMGILAMFSSILVFAVLRFNQMVTFKNVKKIALTLAVGLIVMLVLFDNFLVPYQRQRYLELEDPIHAYWRSRGFAWKTLPDILLRYPLGAGLRHSEMISPQLFGVEPLDIYLGDIYLRIVAAELGIPGLAALLFLYLIIVKEFIRAYNSERGFEARVVMASFISLAAISMMMNIYGNGGWTLWLSLGVVFGASDYYGRGQRDVKNKMVEASIMKTTLQNAFNESRLNNLLLSGSWTAAYDILRSSKLSLLLGHSETILIKSRFFRILRKIVD